MATPFTLRYPFICKFFSVDYTLHVKHNCSNFHSNVESGAGHRKYECSENVFPNVNFVFLCLFLLTVNPLILLALECTECFVITYSV